MKWRELTLAPSCMGESTKRALSAASIFFLVLLCSLSVKAQEQRSARASPSELAQENMSLVAASPADIKAVLVKDAGLMVELKRWVAKDATNHGQIISESDLTNDAIFNRLENDVQFRSVATLLLQRYGYLVPNVNPESPIGKEQELLIQERVKWITEDEEEERTQKRQESKELEKARACAEGVGTDCPQRQPSAAPQTAGQTLGGGVLQPNTPSILPGESAPQGNPGQPNLGVPSEDGIPLERAQLLRTSEEGADSLTGLGTGSGIPSGAGRSVDGLGGELQPPRAGSSTSLSPLDGLASETDGFSQKDGSVGLLDSTSAGNGSDFYTGSMNPRGGLEAVSPAYPTGTPAIRRSPYGREYQPKTTLEPVMNRVANPYLDIPSLYDMYVQASPHPARLRRFGIDVFENGTRDPQLIPMDLPAGPDYVVGPGDGLSVSLWGSVSRRVVGTVDREGRLSLPEVGPVLVSGQSLADVQRNIQQVLRTQFRDVSADVSLSRLRTIRVYEVGDVVSPGAYDISSLSTPLNALFAAGGPTPQGSLRIVKHYRGNQLLEVVDLYDLLLHGVKADILRLDNGDTVLVPPIGGQVTVEGMVRRPAIYELKDEKDLGSVLALAGGLLPTAALDHIEVQRLVAHEKQTMLSLDIPNAGNEAEVAEKLKSFEIQAGDRIRVFPIAQGNEDAVYLEGHVIRPGRYAYRSDMRVSDVIPSFKDLLPEPSLQYAEIIRLNAPDFHPTVVGFDLSDALTNPAQAPVLRPRDTIRIFSRFDFENAPTVSVLGDVRKPGTYQTSGQVRVSDAVYLAGGLAPEAEKGDAQVFRYLPDGKAKIFSVNLSEALAGNATENLLLEPRDRLLIHESPDAEQPATVYVEGEVEKPGRYPLTTNMTVADLIRVGGGLKPSADTEVGDLTLYQRPSESKLEGRHEPLNIAAALSGDPKADVPLHNGDVVTIRELPGWSDLGASISLKGEVKHPGTYGIKPGERLSSIIERAGGFRPDAYPYGAVLQRVQVRELEAKQQDELILRVKDAQHDLELMPDTDPKQKQAREATFAQYQATLTQLGANPPAGRVTIRISSNINHWKNTAADIEVRAGDTLTIPKRPDYVMVTGQVFNPTAVAYRPGKSANWYLSQSGGPTTTADKKSIFVIRADGSVIGAKNGMWGGDTLSATLQPGDTVIVPEKAMGGGPNWQAVFMSAQVASGIASTIFLALHY
jgi:polysaccharide biosynthesis/export protein